ncbi:MAG: DUF2845 domain-containing protein [Lysobacterales bacterium]|jgi:hypothetical protein
MSGIHRITYLTTLCLLLLMLWSSLRADSYRCGRKLIRTGDTTAQVLSLCGEPRYRERGSEEIRYDGRRQRLPVQRWYYRKNDRSLWRVVMIYKGRVAAIEMGGR